MYNWFTFLYTWNELNIVNQLYFNNFFLIITTAKVSNNRVFCVPIPHEIFLHFLYQKIIDH